MTPEEAVEKAIRAGVEMCTDSAYPNRIPELGWMDWAKKWLLTIPLSGSRGSFQCCLAAQLVDIPPGTYVPRSTRTKATILWSAATAATWLDSGDPERAKRLAEEALRTYEKEREERGQ